MIHFERSDLFIFALRAATILGLVVGLVILRLCGAWAALAWMALVFLATTVAPWLFQPAIYRWTRRCPALMAERAARGLEPIDPSPLPFARRRPVVGPTIRLDD